MDGFGLSMVSTFKDLDRAKKWTRMKKSKKDPNQLAHSIVQQVTQSASDHPQKNPAAVALGRLGGLKGGKARAKKLSSQRRIEIAHKAAQTRWGKKS